MPTPEELAAFILGKKQAGQPLVIAIDGRCGAGKTTLANQLSRLIGGEILHMDDFFLPPDMRTPERLAAPGGNIHYERFLAEVEAGLLAGTPFSYGAFDCSAGAITARRTIDPQKPVIVEGSYCLHPRLNHLYTVRLFCDIDPVRQKERLLAREGAAKLSNFVHKWIPLEETYFTTYSIAEHCDKTLRLS